MENQLFTYLMKFIEKDTAAQKAGLKTNIIILREEIFFSELHGWYEKNNIEFINSIPSYNKKIDFVTKTSKGDAIDQFNLQLIDLFENKEGGLFLFLGKKFKNSINKWRQS